MRSFRTVTAITLAVLCVTGVTFGTAPVAADGDDPALGGVFDDDLSTSEKASASWNAARGGWNRATNWAGENAPGFVQDLVGVEEPSARDKATAVTTLYNGNNETLERWINDRTTVSSNKTVEVTFHLNHETATRYVEVNTTDGNITRSEMVATTDRTPDETLDVCGYAAEKAPTELETFIKEFAEPNEDVTPAYLGRMRGAYKKDVETTLLRSDGDCPGGGS